VALAASVAHRVVLLKAGHVIADGAPEAALTPEALKQAYERTGRLHRIDGRYAAVFD
jgi:ABC-type hemin transport system ATPase subunit